MKRGEAPYLFVGNDMYGVINTILGLAQALVIRGKQVLFRAGPAFRQHIEGHAVPFDELHYPSLSYPLHTASVCLSSLLCAENMLRHEQKRLRALNPSCVVTSWDGLPGMVVAQILNIPLIVVTPFEVNRRFLEAFWRHNSFDRFRDTFTHVLQQRLAHDYDALAFRMQHDFGLKLPQHILDCAWGQICDGPHRKNIVANSPRFLGPYCLRPRSSTFVGPMQRHEQTTERRQRTAALPLVYISLGTVYGRNQAFFDFCSESLGPAPVQVIYSCGLADIDTTSAPRNFTVVPFLSQLAALSSASVFVTHGGFNSVTEAIMACVPMVVVPQGYDQFVLSERIECLGLGVVADTSIGSRAFSQRVLSLATSVEVRSRLNEVAEDFRRYGGVAKATSIVEALVDASRSKL